jgi:hypothetical protein
MKVDKLKISQLSYAKYEEKTHIGELGYNLLLLLCEVM